MKVYVFGNADLPDDNRALTTAKKIKPSMPEIDFISINPNEDVPFAEAKKVVILDTVVGIDKIEIITGNDLFKISAPPRSSVHDFDLAFQLKYLKKLGKLGEVIIIGIPTQNEIDYDRIQSILRKLVAQDMQGS